MKAFFAYALLVVGVPVFVGMAIGGIITAPLGRLLHTKTSLSLTTGPRLADFLEVADGFMASVAGAFLFRLFGLTPRPAVPIIMSTWITFYFFAYHQPKQAWVSWLAGLLIGWFLFLHFFQT
jgi:hypothetical protein